MPDDGPNRTPERLEELASLLADVRRATALRPAAEQDTYEKAQDSVIEARRVAEAKAGTLKIVH